MLCQIQLPPCAVFRHKTMLLAEYHTQASLQGTLPDRKAAMYRRFARCRFRACIQRDRAAKDRHDPSALSRPTNGEIPVHHTVPKPRGWMKKRSSPS